MASFDENLLFRINENVVDGICYTTYLYEDNVVVFAKCNDAVEEYDAMSETGRHDVSYTGRPGVIGLDQSEVSAMRDVSESTQRDTSVVILDEGTVETRDTDDPIDCMLTIQSFGKYPLSYKVMREMAEFFEIGKYIDISKIGDIVCIEPLVFDRREFDDRNDGHRRHDGHRDDDEHRDVDVWTDVDRRHKEPERRYIAGQQNRDHPRFFI